AAYTGLLSQGPTAFTGYDETEPRTRIRGILCEGGSVDALSGQEGETAETILDETPFYAEAGGQVGDTGRLTTTTGAARVVHTFAPAPGLIVHRVELAFGRLEKGQEVEASVDAERRRRIAANHTGTHLLHAVLRDLLGLHV